MKVYAISDIHVDYDENRKWLNNLSEIDFKDDILIVAGDIMDVFSLMLKMFETLKNKFFEVLYVPGNHDLWVWRNNKISFFEKFNQIKTAAKNYGISMEPATFGTLTLVPLYGWYDYSFGEPSAKLEKMWSDYTACKWPENYFDGKVTDYFLKLNKSFLHVRNQVVISFSHFVPRIDICPSIFLFTAENYILYWVLLCWSNRFVNWVRKFMSMGTPMSICMQAWTIRSILTMRMVILMKLK